MFFIGVFGVNQGQKEIAVQNNVTCAFCGHLTRYRIIKTYTYFHIFFIPTFRWHVRYFVKSECCGGQAELDRETGERFARGESPSIDSQKLSWTGGQQKTQERICRSCGRSFDVDFQYCPYCGRPLD